MSCILYYSNFCEPSKKLIGVITKSQSMDKIHFVCIDKRVKGDDGKTYILLENGQRLVMPTTVTRVPALMLLNQGYKVIYGNEIYDHLRPQQQLQMRQATGNNMEPMTRQQVPQVGSGPASAQFNVSAIGSYDSFGGFGGMGGIVSDNFSFLDQSPQEFDVAQGNGGLRQMHNYVSLNESFNPANMMTPSDNYNSNKIKDGELSIESLQRKREAELNGISYR